MWKAQMMRMPYKVVPWAFRRKHTVACGSVQRSTPFSNEISSKFSVILIGWLGAKEKHLHKYVDTWNALGIDSTFSFRPGMKSMVLSSHCKKEAQQFLQQKRELNEIVVYHVFSLAGYTFFTTLVNEAKRLKGMEVNPSGIIFDSGPGQLYAQTATAGLLTAAAGISESSALEFYSKNRSLCHIFWNIYDKFSNRSEELEFLGQSFEKQSPKSQMFLYSEQDAIIPCGDIESFIQRQEENEKSIFRSKWSSGNHVQLLKQHKEEYIMQMEKFLMHLLQSP